MEKHSMSGKSLLTINALVWAVVILASAYFFKQEENYNVLLGITVVAYTLVNGMIYTYLKQNGQLQDRDCSK